MVEVEPAEERPVIVHQPGCTLEYVHWLRQAIAAAGVLAQEPRHVDDDAVDRMSVMALTDALAHFAELDSWASVTLSDIANQATLMNQEQFRSQCTCGAFD
jgi:hypothetical protein